MHVFFAVLLWVLLALLILLLLVLFLPVGISVRVDYDKPVVWLRVLFFKLRLYPQKPKKSKENKKHEAEKEAAGQMNAQNANSSQSTKNEEGAVNNGKAEEKDNKTAPKHSGKRLSLSLEKILGIIGSAGKAVKIIFKGLFFTKIELVYPVHSGDSAETAINYGKTQAYFGAMAATAQNFVHLSFKRVHIIPDFTNEHKYKRYFYCNIWSVTFIMIVAAVYLFISLRREKIF